MLRTIYKKNDKAQVWVESVLYLLIGLAIIGLILAFVKPKIAEIQDKIVIDQSLDLLKELDNEIIKVWNNGEGNQQVEEIEIKRGELVIKAQNNEIWYVLKESNVVYSQPGETFTIGNIERLTEKKGSTQDVYLKLKYRDSINLLFEGENKEKILTKAATPYKLSIRNNGTAIDIKQI